MVYDKLVKEQTSLATSFETKSARPQIPAVSWALFFTLITTAPICVDPLWISQVSFIYGYIFSSGDLSNLKQPLWHTSACTTTSTTSSLFKVDKMSRSTAPCYSRSLNVPTRKQPLVYSLQETPTAVVAASPQAEPLPRTPCSSQKRNRSLVTAGAAEHIPSTGSVTLLRDTHPGGVNSVWPMSHSM